MINQTLFSKIKKNLEAYQHERNQIINRSRQILQDAKKTIFALHRQDNKSADGFLKSAQKSLTELNQKYDKGNRLKFEGSYKAAVEEFVEASFFAQALKGKSLAELKIGSIGPEEYLGGLADLTGELVRQAVLQATAGNYKELERYRQLTEEIVGFMLQLYLTGYQRQKFDEAKRNLKRLEQMIYEVRLRG
ncbi:MAG TPA: hypothetical protein VJB39_01590 [Patescibacteria group bacterium]|nr:hypothetical protein [Patescibacteria group bacterium]